MTAQSGPYSRFYWRFRDEYPDIYQDKETFGWWLTLLVNAEGAHPSAADLPRKVRPRSLEKLIDEQLVVLLPGDRYRVKGLAKERERRAEQGRNGGLASGRSRSQRTTVEQPENDGSTTVELDETRRDKQRQDETRNTARPFVLPVKDMDGGVSDVAIGSELPADWPKLQALAEELTGQPYAFPSPYAKLAQKAITEQLQPHRWGRLEKAWRQVAARFSAEGGVRPTIRQLVFGADDLLNPIPTGLSKEAAEDAEQRRYDRRVQATQQRIREMQA